MEPHGIPKELVNRFPENVDQISQLLAKNKDFMEIVDDYRYCLDKLTSLQDPPGKINPLRKHYQNALNDLEEEMIRYFET